MRLPFFALIFIALASCTDSVERGTAGATYGFIHVENGCYCHKKMTPGVGIAANTPAIIKLQNIAIGVESKPVAGQANVGVGVKYLIQK